ncbi:MAG: hypothetical protein MK012_06170, partial [Dehalococcoidia bacterium]|nr:hypothetical protein [Dehalococcoidia bacterium]
MKIVLFKTSDNKIYPGVMTENGVTDISSLYHTEDISGQDIIVNLINNYESKNELISTLVEAKAPISFENIKLLPPLPRPSKILCCIGNYWEHAQRDA